VVRSSIQLLMLKRRTAEEYSAGLERVLEDNVRVEALVSQMLLLARLEEASGGDVAPLDLSAVAKEVLSRLQPVAEEQQLELRSDCQSGTMVRISLERAQVLISNIVMNAIQHSRPGMPVGIRVAPRGEANVHFEVKDCGDGIGEEALPHIFERFYREDRSRSRHTGGTGLGLAICKSIADGAGATIHVASQSGQGTCVTVIFSAA
jgi:signal transduction histidine kinase